MTELRITVKLTTPDHRWIDGEGERLADTVEDTLRGSHLPPDVTFDVTYAIDPA